MMGTTLDSAFQRVRELVARFKANEARYLSADYQEAEVRKDFIDKFFIALGWDVNHDHQTNPYEQEVKVEPPVSATGQRRADYSFHLAPNFRDVRFFVEAKKPHSDIATNHNYFQTIRYGWNSETPLAVLTDFEQFHILDCRYKPDLDAALNRYISKYHYTDYAKPEKFAEIYWLFSHEAVAGRSLEKRAEELPKPRGKAVQRGLFAGGYQSIDESFLKELDEYRTTLARAFKSKNPEFDSATLTELAQRTLDRLVFLRFLEDKGIEAQRLVDYFGDKGTAWEDFIAASRRLDGIYNGIVFKQHGILDAQDFRVDDNAFADICESLAHVNTPYDFNAIPIHVLGSIYERFLGKVIVATDKRVRVEDKPEVRKAGGVYYTPEYIVRYIVENTVGKLIAGKTPAQIAEMRFADIACGSGSFLLGVYDLLLQYHGHYYNDNPGKARKGDCIKRDSKFYLSLRKKREILVNNIYGVDIDAQAVEVCQLSLYLKLMQEETETSTRQYLLDFEHIAQMKKLLPDLSKNIVCGNSLIGMDILDDDLFPRDEERKLNPMNFEDAFPEVMNRGGFDAIVGNPPWISLKGKFGNEIMPASALEYLVKKFHGDTYRPNIYEFFVRQGVRIARQSGLISFIVPDRLGLNLQFENTRKEILRSCTLESLLYKAKFPNVIADTLIFVLSRRPAEADHKVRIEEFERGTAEILQSEYATMPEHRFAYPRDIANVAIFSAIDAKKHLARLDQILHSSVGFIAVSKSVSRKRQSSGQMKVLKGENVLRYGLEGNFWFDWKKSNLAGGTQDTAKLGATPKVLLRKTGSPLYATLETKGLFPEQSLYFLYPREGIRCDCRFYLGILNSRFFHFFFMNRLGTNLDSTPQIKKVHLDAFPLPTLRFDNPSDKARHDQMVAKVEAMLAAKKELAKAKTDKDKTYYESKCVSLDGQIDRLVYDLYGLTAEEIAIVEKTNT